jgi:hypothetical protein
VKMSSARQSRTSVIVHQPQEKDHSFGFDMTV